MIKDKPTLREWMRVNKISIVALADFTHRDPGYICGVLTGRHILGTALFNDLPKNMREQCSLKGIVMSNELQHLLANKRMEMICDELEDLVDVIGQEKYEKILDIVDGYFDGTFDVEVSYEKKL